MVQSRHSAAYSRLLHHYSVTDGLARGAGLVDSVALTAAFALLPGFGIYGLFISNAIQHTITGCLEIPFGWIADRFGWTKAVIFSFALRCVTASLMLLAVISAWWDHRGLAWAFVGMQAILDAFAAALESGAYEAAYTEWYRVKISEERIEPHETPPPLFIRSLRYSMWIRFLIPASVVCFVMVLHAIPGVGTINTYTASTIALTLALFFNAVTFFRVSADLLPLRGRETERLSDQKASSGIKLIEIVWRSVGDNLSAFILYTFACFQYALAVTFLSGIAVKEMNKMAFPQPYGWFAGVSLILAIYFLDSFFWMIAGYRIRRENAAVWIRNLGLLLLLTCLLAAMAQVIDTHPLFQSLCLGACVLSGMLCGGSIKRFFASHLRDWLDSDFVATWFSIAGCLSILALGILGVVVVYLDRFIPNATVLLLVSLWVTIGIISCLTSGALNHRHEDVVLRSLLAKTFLSVATLVFGIVGVITVYTSILFLEYQYQQQERLYLAGLTGLVGAHASAELGDLKTSLPMALGGLTNFDVCQTAGGSGSARLLPPCLDSRFSLASKTYSFEAPTFDGRSVHLSIRFARTSLIRKALGLMGIVVLFSACGIVALYRLLLGRTRQIDQELKLLFDFAENDSEDHAKVLDSFLVTEFRDMARRLDGVAELKREMTRNKVITEVSARVAHDIRSPLLVFEMLSSELHPLPEKVRLALRNAIHRVREIAHALFDVERQARDNVVAIRTDPQTDCLLSTVLQSVVSEKRMAFRDRIDLKIESHLSSSALGAFILVNPAVLACVVSNIIQNSAEAIEGPGNIRIDLTASNGWVSVVISDDGKGIPASVLPALMHERKTYGKQNGNGLGLFNALQAMKSWKGEIDLESSEGVGTKVTLSFRRAEAPSWFVPRLKVSGKHFICVLDDDPAIHGLWQRRLASLYLTQCPLHLVHFSRSLELETWLNKNRDMSDKLLLIAQDLPNEETSGTDVISRIELRESVFLVTNYFDNPSVVNKCAELGIGLIPKALALSLPIVTDVA
jgi:signal transduction histidine kinase